jgi:hypothetical protein
MDGRNQQKIRKYLEEHAVQKRVLRNIGRGRDDLTVTIGRAAELSGFSISQLRDWEKKGLLKPLRSEAADAKGASGQRQYSVSELDKLGIIRELIIDAHFSPSAIPTNIDEIWASILRSSEVIGDEPQESYSSTEKFLPMGKRVDVVYLEHFYWRFYASHALLLVLMLVTEDVPGTYSGLILPMKKRRSADHVPSSSDIAQVGESLVGWLDQTRSFCTLLVQAPSFEYPSDFSVVPLSVDDESVRARGAEDRTLIFVQRDEVKKLNLTKEIVETAQSLLRPLYEDRQDWQKYFGEGMKDLLNPGIDFTPRLPDMVLTGLANMVVRLGGKKADGEDRWRFCYILLPENLSLPLQQRSLVVRAMSENGRHAIGVTTLTPERYRTSLSIRAFQGGHIIYRQELSERDTTAEARETEGPVRSNIAVPIGGEIGEPLGIIYVASYVTDAFSERDRRVLRIMARMIEELLSGYAAQRQLTKNLAEVVKEPELVDTSFKEFGSENDFISDIEEMLKYINEQVDLEKRDEGTLKSSNFSGVPPLSGEISFIAIDIDDQDRIVREYNEETLRNLQKTIGQRVRDLLPALFTRYVDCKPYYIYAGRFYLFLRDFPLDVTKRNAERLKKALEGNIAIKQPDMIGSTLIIPNVSLHLAVGWYSYEKLQEFLEMVEQYKSVSDISATIYRTLDSVLKLGMDDGGNVIYSWDPKTETFAAYQAGDLRK